MADLRHNPFQEPCVPTLILDTCVVTALPWNSTVWELFRAVRAAGTGRIAIPEMVLIELLAQRGREYSSALDKATAAHRALWKLQFVDIDATHVWPAVYSPEDSLQKWEAIYRQTMEVLPLTREAAVEGLRREAHRLRPARASGKTATGSRDAAIWMTVLEQAKVDPTWPVYFVSSNVNDFGPNGKLYPDMADEVNVAGVSIEYLTDLDEALSRISRREDLAHDDEGLAERVTAATTTQALWSFIVESMEGQQVAGAVVDLDDEAPFAEWESAWSELKVRMIEVASWSSAASYAVGPADSPVRTLAATVSILVGGEARRWTRRMGSGDLEPAAFAIDLRLLFGPGSISVASAGEPRSFTAAEDDAATAMAVRLCAGHGYSVPRLLQHQEEL
ncbi:PIN domain-containing protein [Streptomyces sp. NPDC091212]|uniref:PIN domain-containing protein n=1 Tax=Streptomyces sp. NPDC091212 TaxID=3155191 RepID=UPI0034302718